MLSNGIVALAAVAAGLIWIYDADVEALIHLYVIGVFTAFTLSQTGWCGTGCAPKTRAGAGEH